MIAIQLIDRLLDERGRFALAHLVEERQGGAGVIERGVLQFLSIVHSTPKKETGDVPELVVASIAEYWKPRLH